MAREDGVLKVVLSDPIIKDKYGIDPKSYHTVDQALKSEKPIICAIAMLIRGLASDNGMNEKAIYQQITSYLNRS